MGLAKENKENIIFYSGEHFKYPDFPFHVKIAEVEYETYPLHAHQFIELSIILGGSGVHFFNEDEYPIAAGDCFVINRPFAHGFKNLNRQKICDIHFEPSFIKPYEKRLNKLPGYNALFHVEPHFRSQNRFRNKLHLEPSDLAMIEPMLIQMEQEYNNGTPGFEVVLTGMLLQLIAQLSRFYEKQKTIYSEPFMKLADTIAYMQTNFQKNLTLKDLAVKSGMSVSYFINVFKKLFKSTPIDYILQLRIQNACKLLRETAMKVSDIATVVGFIDSNYFTRQFTKIMKQTPRTFRQGMFRNSLK